MLESIGFESGCRMFHAMTKNDIKNAPCTVWSNYESNKANIWPLWYVLKKVPHFSQNESRISKLRGLDGEARRDIKRTLPVWMPGVWTDKTKDGLQEFSGFVQFDLDHLPDPHAAKLILQTIPSVALVAVSVSGRGLYGLLSVPDDAKDESRYQAYFRAFSRHLKGMGIEMDTQTININRLRFISLDDGFYIPSRCETWTEAVEAPPTSVTVSSSPSPSYTSTVTHTVDTNRKQYGYAQRLSFCQSLTDQALALGIDPAPTKTLWYTMGRSLASDFREDGRDMFTSLSGLWESQHGHQTVDPDAMFDECIRLADQWEGGCFAFQRIMRDAGIRLKK